MLDFVLIHVMQLSAINLQKKVRLKNHIIVTYICVELCAKNFRPIVFV